MIVQPEKAIQYY